MEFESLIGYEDDASSYITLKIENGDNHDSIGDQIWISPDGKKMEVCDSADYEVLREAEELFKPSHRLAFRGALRRMGIDYQYD